MAFLINIIGAGNLGKTLGYLFSKHGAAKIGGVCNTTKQSSDHAIQFIEAGTAYEKISDLPSSDITLITTPDDSITEVCKELSKNQFLKNESTILHCSGSLSSDVLFSVKKTGCYVASAHPMASFAKPELSIQQYEGTYCAIEGDQETLPLVSSIFDSIGSITYQINKIKKSVYHAAGVFSSNYLVTLAQKSLLCMNEAGVENEMAMRVITNIMKGTISNLEKTLSPKQSLTGPIKRGDNSTIIKHMECLEKKERNLYSILGQETLSLTSHEEEKIKEMTDILNIK